MPRDARFWRNVTVIGLAHIAILIGLIRWSREAKKTNPSDMVWIQGGEIDSGEATPSPKQTPNQLERTPLPTPEPSKAEEAANEPSIAPVKSEIQLPTPTPVVVETPTPKRAVTPKPSPKPSPSATAKPKSKPTPKKPLIAKTTPKPTAKPKEKDNGDQADEAETKKNEIAKAALAKKKATAAGAGGQGGGAGSASEFNWYGNMLHDRFYSEWVQPTTVVASGVKLSALVKLRIEKDGRVAQFTVIKPSGNVVVDESVAAVAKRVTQVDPLPAGLGGKYYEVRINFELNSEQ